jgi:beta-glucosidase
VDVMKGVCRGIVSTVEALHEVDPEILPVHVDATDLYRAKDETDPQLMAEAEHRQELVFLALDLVSGRVTHGHPLMDWLGRHGFTDTDHQWFQEHAVSLPFVGINLYPMFTQKLVTKTPRGGTRIVMRYADGSLIEKLSQLYWNRYHAPLFISETASVGSVRKRKDWLDASVSAVARTRAKEIPLIGYTWWPLFALVTWAYRQGSRPPNDYLVQMGLWDLDPALNRVSTPLVEAYQDYVRRGIPSADLRQPALESVDLSTVGANQ